MRRLLCLFGQFAEFLDLFVAGLYLVLGKLPDFPAGEMFQQSLKLHCRGLRVLRLLLHEMLKFTYCLIVVHGYLFL
jgi:hypothetical protein